MSSSLPFVSANFALQSVSHIGPAVVRVRFTTDPKAISSSGPNDGLNPANYQLSGPNTVLITGTSIVPSDPQAIDIYTNVPLSTGSWTLLAQPALHSEDGVGIGNPSALTFSVSVTVSVNTITGGAVSDTAENIIRKHLPRTFIGRAWDALIAALGASDQVNISNAILAFDQLFLKSASAQYLDRRASEIGVQRPNAVGMSDDAFRSFAIKFSSKKVTTHTLLEILEAFYGTDAVRAFVETVNEEPFALIDGQGLKVFDGQKELEVIFLSADFGQLGLATADEVSAVISRQLRSADIAAYAQTVTDPITLKRRVRIYSSALGLTSTLIVAGGLAQNSLRFPLKIPLSDFNAGTNFGITIPSPGVARYTSTSAQNPLLQVVPGDSVNITCPNFTALNRGSFAVKRVSTTWNGANWVSFFEIENRDVVAEAGPLATVATTDIQFYRPQRATLSNISGRIVVLAQNDGAVDAVLPATTQAVGRDELTAAYLPGRSLINITQLELTADGVATVTTATPHGLAASNHVILDGLYPTTAVPAQLAGSLGSAGNPGTTAAAQTDLWTPVRSDLTAREQMGICRLSSGDVLVTGGRTPGGTYFATGSRFRLISKNPLSSGVANGRSTYTYNWIAAAALPATSSNHDTIALEGSFAGKALRTGGRNGGGTHATAQLYDEATDTWTTVPNGTLTARFNHATVRVVDAAGADVVYIIGGQSNDTTAIGNVEKFTTAAGGTLAATALSDATGRARAQAVAITSTAFIVVGGATLGPQVPRHDCWGFDESTGLTFPVGHMALARVDHAAVRIAEGTVMVIGGHGRSLSNETTDRYLSECEIWDSTTKVWRPAPKMRFPRMKPHAVVMNNRVYVWGGWTTGDIEVKSLEVYDIAENKWLSATKDFGEVADHLNSAGSLWAEGVLFSYGGRTTGGVESNDANVFVPGVTLGGQDLLNAQVKIATTPAADKFTFSVATGKYALLTGGTALLVPAAITSWKGPYLWNPDDDPTVTAVEATLQHALAAGQQYATLTLDNAASFPDGEGWLALGFGTKNAIFPVKYLGRISSTVLILDYAFKMPRDIPLGAKVTLLAQKGPYEPANAEELGSAYITGSSAGRVAAQRALEEAVAAGRALNITVAYPGDKGLGGAGLPATGQKISDKVAVWGGDDLDAELAKARGES